jgi:hypothetical protein
MQTWGDKMKRYLFLLPLAALAACGQGETTELKDPCAEIATIVAARSEAEPFTSLRGEQRMLGDSPLPDAWESNDTFKDSACRVSVMRGFFGGDTNIHIYTCDLFEAGTMNKDADGKLAEAAYEGAVSNVKACLGDAWTFEADTESSQYEVYGKTVFKPAQPEEQVGDFRADPLYVEMRYAGFGGGRNSTPGWLVTLQAQKQTSAD